MRYVNRRKQHYTRSKTVGNEFNLFVTIVPTAEDKCSWNGTKKCNQHVAITNTRYNIIWVKHVIDDAID